MFRHFLYFVTRFYFCVTRFHFKFWEKIRHQFRDPFENFSFLNITYIVSFSIYLRKNNKIETNKCDFIFWKTRFLYRFSILFYTFNLLKIFSKNYSISFTLLFFMITFLMKLLFSNWTHNSFTSEFQIFTSENYDRKN